MTLRLMDRPKEGVLQITSLQDYNSPHADFGY